MVSVVWLRLLWSGPRQVVRLCVNATAMSQIGWPQWLVGRCQQVKVSAATKICTIGPSLDTFPERSMEERAKSLGRMEESVGGELGARRHTHFGRPIVALAGTAGTSQASLGDWNAALRQMQRNPCERSALEGVGLQSAQT